MAKNSLEARIAELEAQVVALRAQLAASQHCYPYWSVIPPSSPWRVGPRPGEVWCGTTNTLQINTSGVRC